VALVLLPLGVATVGADSGETRGFPAELSAAFGFVAFAVLCLELALVSRLRAASDAFGTDALMLFHRQMALCALAFLGAHALIEVARLRSPALLSPFAGSAALRGGAIAFWSTLAIVGSSLARRRLRLSFEVWRDLHSLLVLVIVASMLAHALGASAEARPLGVRFTLCAYAAAFAALMLRYRLVRPLLLSRRPWEVVACRDEGGSTRTLVLRPVGHEGFEFEPGQFAWIITGRTALFGEQHPITIASSAMLPPDRSLEFSIKALGDWSGRLVPALRPGARVWVDGPFGALTPDRVAAQGLALVAGGIGITPMRSILLTLRDRGDRRPVVLFHAARNRGRMLFERELAALRARLDLTIVQVFEEPESGARCEQGYLTAGILRRHLPADLRPFAFLLCGPGPMIDSVERDLASLGVPPQRILSERFDLL
jgi:predicted ferric reductase